MKKSNLKTLLRAILVAGLAMAFFTDSNNATANDDKTYPASICQPQFEDTPYDINYSGRIENHDSNNELYVFCPLYRDLFSSYYTWSTLELRVYDRHPSKDIDCTLILYNSQSSVGDYSFRNGRSSGSSASWQTLTIAPFSPDNGQPYHSYHVSCNIPESYSGNVSKIASIYIDERS